MKTVGRVKFRTWDLGGHLQVRSFWKEYLVDIDAIVFVVDSADRDRMEEARKVRNKNYQKYFLKLTKTNINQKELEELLNDEDLEDTTFMILANKTDVEGYCSELEIERNLNINLPANRNKTNPEGGRLINVYIFNTYFTATNYSNPTFLFVQTVIYVFLSKRNWCKRSICLVVRSCVKKIRKNKILIYFSQILNIQKFTTKTHEGIDEKMVIYL